MRTLSATSIALTVLATTSLHAAPGAKFAGARLIHLAKVSLPAAKASALKVRSGTVVNQELEKEKGGSGLRYSFDIKAGTQVYEVGVDARTGQILENAREGPHLD